MPRQRPTIVVEPNMKAGDAEKMVAQLEATGLPPVPWQRDFLNLLESASTETRDDLGNDPDGDLDGYDGGYGPVLCACPSRPKFGPQISCPKCGGRYD